MLYIIIATVIMLALLDKALRQGRLDRTRLEARFGLFALRDELRLSAIRGETAHDRWFEYLDTTLTKTIDRLQDINLWESMALVLIYGKNESILRAQEKLEAALKRPENRRLAEIDYKFTVCIANFLMRRHYALTHTFAALATLGGKSGGANRPTEPDSTVLPCDGNHAAPPPRRAGFAAEEAELPVDRVPNRGLVTIFGKAPETSTLLEYAH